MTSKAGLLNKGDILMERLVVLNGKLLQTKPLQVSPLRCVADGLAN